jgi:hypothetical protein
VETGGTIGTGDALEMEWMMMWTASRTTPRSDRTSQSSLASREEVHHPTPHLSPATPQCLTKSLVVYRFENFKPSLPLVLESELSLCFVFFASHSDIPKCRIPLPQVPGGAPPGGGIRMPGMPPRPSPADTTASESNLLSSVGGGEHATSSRSESNLLSSSNSEFIEQSMNSAQLSRPTISSMLKFAAI